jgi:hypothetical protein
LESGITEPTISEEQTYIIGTNGSQISFADLGVEFTVSPTFCKFKVQVDLTNQNIKEGETE